MTEKSHQALLEENRRMRAFLREIAPTNPAAAALLEEMDGRSRNIGFKREERRQTATEASRRWAAEQRARIEPVVAELWGRHLTIREIAEELNRRGIRTPRGGEWKPANLQNFLPNKQKDTDNVE